MSQPKSNARPRKVVITINYHYTSAGRRAGLRKDIKRSVVNAIVRRLERHGALVVDSIDVEEEGLALGA